LRKNPIGPTPSFNLSAADGRGRIECRCWRWYWL
jgi:hypothetical protein